MNLKIGCRPEAEVWRKNQPFGFSLFELLISLALISLVMVLLMNMEMQTARMWRDLDDEVELINEGRTLLQMISRDLRSASLCSENLNIDIPLASCQKNIFFLTRSSSDDLVTAGYFLDPGKKGYCYRFFANAQETLRARSQEKLTELESRAAAGEAHSELITRHLLSWEITPFWNNEKKMILLEINLAFGKTTPSYFLSTVVSIQNSSIL